METLSHISDAIFGVQLRSQEMGVGQMCARALAIYIALLVVVRFGKKRFLGKATAFDAILVIMIGSIAGRAITGGAPLLPAIGAEVVLIAVHWVFSAVACTSPFFSNLVKGNATRLVRDGDIDEAALKAAHMSVDDLEEDLRQEGVASASYVKEARLERSGQLSVINKQVSAMPR